MDDLGGKTTIFGNTHMFFIFTLHRNSTLWSTSDSKMWPVDSCVTGRWPVGCLAHRFGRKWDARWDASFRNGWIGHVYWCRFCGKVWSESSKKKKKISKKPEIHPVVVIFFWGELVHLLKKQFPVATEPKKAPSETHLLQRLLIYQTFPLCSRKNRLWRVLDFRGHLEKIQVGTMDQEMFEPKLRWNVCF